MTSCAAAPASAVASPAAARSQRGIDPGHGLLAVALTLVALGLVMVYSSTAVECDRRFGDPAFFLRRQLVWSLVAGLTLLLARSTDYHALVRLSRLGTLALCLLLIAVLFQPGHKGAHRWFHLGAFQFQPSELGKILLVLLCARECGRLGRLPTAPGLRQTLPLFAAVGAVVGLVAIEPDFGTALFLCAITGVLLLAGAIPLRHLFVVGLPASLAALAYGLTRLEHVRARLRVFLDPAGDVLGKGYQVHQSLIALGSGGLTGLGLGRSRQKLYFLPDDHTDFILAIIGEELGLIGTLVVLALFVALVGFGVRIALRAPDLEGRLVALGLTTAIGLQACMNIAVVTASMPTKGISLPFVSYGGSALVVTLGAVGLLLNVAAQSRGPQP
ncbi:MAG: cell division protein FtsW [Planctomycetota bacterium]|nr:MAG: cell division protein FtsW [Planctomycetota bacterium]